MNIYHSSIRDYVSDFSNCSLCGLQPIQTPHSTLAYSSLRLMIQDLPQRTVLIDALLELKSLNQAMEPHDPRNLQQSLAFIIEPLAPSQVLMSIMASGSSRAGLTVLARNFGWTCMDADPRRGRLSADPERRRLAADPRRGVLAADPHGRHSVADREGARVAAEWARMVMDSEETETSCWRP